MKLRNEKYQVTRLSISFSVLQQKCTNARGSLHIPEGKWMLLRTLSEIDPAP
jgi:hypothetical protein